MKNILFRADSSSSIGTGHIMRDLVLAKQFPNDHIMFATQDLPGNINHKIEEENYKVEILQSEALSELTGIIEKHDIDMVVIDHYNINAEYEKALKEKTGVKLFIIDDTYEKHYCDILLNHNIYAQENKYADLVPAECELRCGINFTLLRKEFLNIKSKEKPNYNQKFKVFIAMGGADSKNFNTKLLTELESSSLQIELVTTKANKNLIQLQEYVTKFKHINLHINSNNIASIISKCDIAIVTPSVIVNEIIFFKIPFISIMVTDNQLYMYNFLKEQGFPCLIMDDLSLLEHAITSLYRKDIYNLHVNKIEKLISQRIKK